MSRNFSISSAKQMFVGLMGTLSTQLISHCAPYDGAARIRHVQDSKTHRGIFLRLWPHLIRKPLHGSHGFAILQSILTTAFPADDVRFPGSLALAGFANSGYFCGGRLSAGPFHALGSTGFGYVPKQLVGAFKAPQAPSRERVVSAIARDRLGYCDAAHSTWKAPGRRAAAEWRRRSNTVVTK
ncbi:hypothetical protein C8R43DRAFT_959554 [Mycena crocata]|nr:hypothetical protein C8R43DRAFT_959554 [Mycena crocata]